MFVDSIVVLNFFFCAFVLLFVVQINILGNFCINIYLKNENSQILFSKNIHLKSKNIQTEKIFIEIRPIV